MPRHQDDAVALADLGFPRPGPQVADGIAVFGGRVRRPVQVRIRERRGEVDLGERSLATVLPDHIDLADPGAQTEPHIEQAHGLAKRHRPHAGGIRQVLFPVPGQDVVARLDLLLVSGGHDPLPLELAVRIREIESLGRTEGSEHRLPAGSGLTYRGSRGGVHLLLHRCVEGEKQGMVHVGLQTGVIHVIVDVSVQDEDVGHLGTIQAV